MPPDQVTRKAFEYRDEHRGLLAARLLDAPPEDDAIFSRDFEPVSQTPQEPDRFYGNVEEALLAANRFRWGGDKSFDPALDMELQKALHDHVMELWRDATWSPSPNYAKAKWLRLQMCGGHHEPEAFQRRTMEALQKNVAHVRTRREQREGASDRG